MIKPMLIGALLATAAACATTHQPTWNDDTVTTLVEGMSKAEIVAQFGDPSSRTTLSGNREQWIYRRAAETDGIEKGFGQYVSVMTLGGRSGENALIVDALTIMFQGDTVQKYKYEENADNNFTRAGGYDE